MRVVQILIMQINALKTQLMYKKMSKRTLEKFQYLTQHSYCSMLTLGKNLKAIRGNGYRFVHKGGMFHTENHHACREKLRFVRSIYPNLPQMGLNLYHGMLIPRHDSIPSFMNFRRVLDLLEFKKPDISMFAAEWRWQGVWHSFSFLAWDLSMHPRTQIWFFNQFICTGACACSSNLNYAHKMQWILS